MNTPFTIYNSSGVILRTGECPENLLELQVGPWPGEFLVAAESDSTKDAVDTTTKKVIKNGRVEGTPIIPSAGNRIVDTVPTRVRDRYMTAALEATIQRVLAKMAEGTV